MTEIEKNFCQYIGEMAIKAMLYEVSATPKPGLVDRHNSGAHKDMDFYTFMASCAALSNTFYQCAQAGIRHNDSSLKKLLSKLRPIGMEGEKRMFEATKGVNTHKGLIFSLGIISAAAGIICRESEKTLFHPEEICEKVAGITEGITENELEKVQKQSECTYGERLFKKYGVKGIRGEVESGFATVRTYALPILQDLVERTSYHLNDILVQVLLHLMIHTEDSNILGRHDIDTLQYVKGVAKEALMLGGMFTAQGREKVIEMDKDFIEKNISPGGAADLLAVSLMLFFLENPKNF